MTSTLIFLLLVGASPATGTAQRAESPEATFKSAIEDFEFGEHAAAAAKLKKILEPPTLESKEDVIVARQYLGACYHLLDEKEKAKAQFSLLLALDPKHKIDPEVFSPAIVAFFEEVRREAGLDAQGRTVEKPKDEGPTKVAEPVKEKTPDVTSELPRVAPKPPPAALALVPFGVGQFANRHYVKGTAFAVSEVGLFATAAITYAMFEGLKVSGPECAGVPECFRAADQGSATTLQTVYLTTFWVGVGVTALGIVEALVSYPGDAVVDAPRHGALGSSGRSAGIEPSFALSPAGAAFTF